MSDAPELEPLQERLRQEEQAYEEVLRALDRLATFELPRERLKEEPRLLAQANALWPTAPPEFAGGVKGRLQHVAWGVVAPMAARQQEWNATVVQLLNESLDENARLHAHLRELVLALMRYVQRVLPVMDARDRVASALATTRSELILDAFDRRQEKLARRLEGLLALRDRLEALSEEMRAVRGALGSEPPPAVQAAAAQAAADSRYVAFENRFRGAPEEIRERLARYVELLRESAPVLDLGCGRGELLQLLGDAGIAASGVESNAGMVGECRARGVEVAQGNLIDALRGAADASLGSVFAAHVAEHLPPPVLQELVAQAHRVLRPGGLLVLETPNPRSVTGFLEVYTRDLTHERPLHPDTLRFLAAAEGFTDVRVEMLSPVDAASRLQPVPTAGLPEETARVLNENAARLNELLYGPQEYVLVARK